jgi:DmsE family decaheme c-type cytochrome
VKKGMKNDSSFVAEHGRKERSSTSAPARTRSRFIRKLALAAASALICWAAFGFSQSVKSEGAFTIAGIESTLPAWSAAANPEQLSQPQQYVDASAISALSSFAQQIGAEAAEPVGTKTAESKLDDHAYSELRAFAQRMVGGQPPSTKDLPKLAAADSLIDFLRQGGAASHPVPAPKEGPVAGGKHPSAPVQANYVGAKTCFICHESQDTEFEKTLMGRIGKTQKGKLDCEKCHGPGSAHVEAGGGRGVGGIISFRPNDLSRTAEENNAICLGCHERGDRTNWHGSTHETRGLMCTNCHTIMKEVSRKHQLKTAFEPDTCFQCHEDRRAQMFRSSHMPLREGKIVCSDCHNPHGSFTEALLREDSINDTCYKCHAEKRGPFLFEHEPVRENCLNCHDPHGTINEYSLKLSRPRLCFECHGGGHALTNGPGAVFTMSRACQNCHTAIHGSNSPAGFFLQR